MEIFPVNGLPCQYSYNRPPEEKSVEKRPTPKRRPSVKQIKSEEEAEETLNKIKSQLAELPLLSNLYYPDPQFSLTFINIYV